MAAVELLKFKIIANVMTVAEQLKLASWQQDVSSRTAKFCK